MKSILITGAHRSGSTWVGSMFNLSSRVKLINEPFHIENSKNLYALDFIDYWFYYLTEDDIQKYFKRLEHVYGITYTLSDLIINFNRINFMRGKLGAIKNFFFFKLYKDIVQIRPVVKDPLAFFSAERLFNILQPEMLILIRHPAAFVSSIKRMSEVEKEWGVNFMFDWIALKEFHPAISEKYKNEIIELKESVSWLSGGILLWRIFHETILYYKNKFANDWHFVKHEDLSRDPVSEFKTLFAAFSIPFTQKIEREIIINTGGGNPIEVTGKKLHHLKRNSKEAIFNWKNRLTDHEIQFIYDSTNDLSLNFYDNNEW